MEERKSSDYSFSRKLISWYESNKRDLPWRETKDPYKIWLSEIILQQTRVVQGMEYYLRMTERFPDVQTLAEAEEDEVLKYWQGLGYYSRARNLHKAAKTVLADLQGIMPTDYDTLLTLKGIGEYTAAAISSFTTNAPHPVVDGNVYRFLSRYLAISEPVNTTKSKKLFTETASELMEKEHAGLFNQAIMEFGALQCTPLPDCPGCPFSDSCLAQMEGNPTAYPVKLNKTKVQTRYFHYFHITMEGYTFLNKRTLKDIWLNLYEFPMIETEEEASFEQLQTTEAFKTLFQDTETSPFQLKISNKKHILSHRVLYASFYEVKIKSLSEKLSHYKMIKEEEIDRYAVHRLMAEFIERRYQNEVYPDKIQATLFQSISFT